MNMSLHHKAFFVACECAEKIAAIFKKGRTAHRPSGQARKTIPVRLLSILALGFLITASGHWILHSVVKEVSVFAAFRSADSENEVGVFIWLDESSTAGLHIIVAEFEWTGFYRAR